MWQSIADGNWLTRARARRFARLSLAATILMIAFLFATAHGTLDRFGRPLGTDFSDVWTAGWMADHGRAALAWDWPSHRAVQQATHHDPAVPFYGWHYPPPFLLVAALLAMLPYVPALVAWQAVTLAAVTALVRRIVPGPDTRLLALGAPVVLVCVGHGHNGFLTASLLGGGLLLLERRPWMAGLLIGCLIYKPQFALLLPLMLIAGGHGRAFAGACVSAAALCGLTLLLWGWPVWAAFIDSLPLTRTVVIEQGSTGWEKIVSAFSAVRMWGGSVPFAYAVQGAVTAVALVGVLVLSWCTRRSVHPEEPLSEVEVASRRTVVACVLRDGSSTSSAPPRDERGHATANVRNAAVMAGALLSTPYVLDYDMVVLGVAIAFLVADGRARGFLRWEVSLLALAWGAPMLARQLTGLSGVPVGLIACLCVFGSAMRRQVVLDGVALKTALRLSLSKPLRGRLLSTLRQAQSERGY